MNKLIIAGISSIALVLILGVVFAYQGNFSTQGPNYSEDRHEAIEQAINNKDYTTWFELMTNEGRTPKVTQLVTEENFEKFIQMHNAQISNDIATAQKLRTELGLGAKNGTGKNMNQKGNGKMQNHSCQNLTN
jgi:repressor of nif and glnA expression